jgi:hypothetical protein
VIEIEVRCNRPNHLMLRSKGREMLCLIKTGMVSVANPLLRTNYGNDGSMDCKTC